MELTANGVRLHYEVQGRGDPLILLHGNGESMEIFSRAVPVLAQTHRVYTLDSRCHGSSQDTDTISYEAMADDCIAFIRALKIQKPALYGFSDGGIVGLLIARKEPSILSKLIVSGANLNPKGLKWTVRMTIHFVAFLRRDKLWRLMERQPRIDHESLAGISVPVHVLAGEKDMVRESHTRLIARSIPGSTLEILPGESHGSYIVDSPKLAPLLLKYL